MGKAIFLVVTAISATASAQLAGGVYRCTDAKGMTEYRNIGNPESATGCKRVEPDGSVRFRSNLKIGDKTTAGLVIEIKQPIAKVQTRSGEKWFRIDELEPVE